MNKKIFVFLILLLVISFSTQALASLTFTTNAITGTTASSIDLGSGNDLNLQTTGRNISIGTSTTLGSKLSIDASGSDTTPLIIKTNGSVGNYTPANSGIFIKDAAGTEILRIFASDPDASTHYNANNLYIGREAGANTTTNNTDSGYFNVGIGSLAFYSNMTGTQNTAIGFGSLSNNTTGSSNVSFGIGALNDNTTGTQNTGIGNIALYENTTGSYNVGIGEALSGNRTGSYNVAIGRFAGLAVDTGSNNVFLGYSAGKYETGSNAFYVDNQNRTNTAGDKAGALLYGTFDATPANQTLKINANLNVNSALNKGTCVLGTSCAAITVAAGAICTATDTTGIFATRAVVSGTTLTITGNGTDTIAYTCL